MARSVGEAAALGLESGFIIGRGTQQMARENARRDRLDQELAEDRQMQRAAAAEQLARQKNLDRIAASQRSSALRAPRTGDRCVQSSHESSHACRTCRMLGEIGCDVAGDDGGAWPICTGAPNMGRESQNASADDFFSCS